jgi:V8-like Glu-specific endopeptidase
VKSLSRCVGLATLGLCLAGVAIAPAQAYEKHRLAARAEMSDAELSRIAEDVQPMARTLRTLPKEVDDPIEPFAEGPGRPQFLRGFAGTLPNPAADASPADEGAAQADDSRARRNFGQGFKNSVYHFSDSALHPALKEYYPYRATGSFVFQSATDGWFRCTATLISQSILVTAGHCVHDGGNEDAGWILQGYFFPARFETTDPFGSAKAISVFTTDGWFTGGRLDKGYDVAIVVLDTPKRGGKEIGISIGWQGFCYRNCLQPAWHITQLGYPANYYNGERVTISEHLSVSDNRDYVYGTGMQGGSSGGPHVANFGTLSNSSPFPGVWPDRNVIFAVTSWGFVDPTLMIQGASSLTGPDNSNQFKPMYNDACSESRAAHGSASCLMVP